MYFKSCYLRTQSYGLFILSIISFIIKIQKRSFVKNLYSNTWRSGSSRSFRCSRYVNFCFLCLLLPGNGPSSHCFLQNICGTIHSRHRHFIQYLSQDSTSEAGLEVISSQRGRLDWRTLQQLNADIVSCAVTSQTATAWSISASLLLDQSREAAGDLAMPRFYSFKKVEQSEFFIVI